MIKIAIVDDEVLYVTQLLDYLRQYEVEQEEGFDISYFIDGDGIVNGYQAQYDIILMDIQMKFMNGMSAAEEIRKIDPHVVIIFITNMKQYAIRGYEVEAFDYIVKPISYFAFSERLKRAISKIRKRPKKIRSLRIKGGIIRVLLEDLYYVESQGHTLIYHTAAGVYEGAGTLQELEAELSEDHFCRGNKSYLINLDRVEGIQDGFAVVHGERLPLGRYKKSGFMERLTEYWGEVR